MARALRLVRRAVPPPAVGFGAWVDLPIEAQRKAAAIAALAPTFRALDQMATRPTVARARATIPELRALLDELEELLND